MDLFSAFVALPTAISAVDFHAVPVGDARADFLAKASDGSPVFLLHDASPARYSPAILLKYVSVQFHNTCRVTTRSREIEDQFAVVSCAADAPDLHEIFVRCVSASVEQLPTHAGTEELHKCVQSLLNLFRAFSRPNSREVTGLWAELFVMLQSGNVARALECWHADPFERFDFSWQSGCLEVKAASRDIRQHEFALEQLQAPRNGVGYIASVLLQPLSGGEGVLDLAKQIESVVASSPTLREKLWMNISAALGAEFSDRLDRKFDPSFAERTLAMYAMSDIPAPPPPADPRVTDVRFRADLMNVASSIGGNSKKVLGSIFDS